MRIYLSGPMRGLPDMGRAEFARGAEALRARDHEVYVPTEQPGGKARVGAAVRMALADNLNWICERAEGVVVLPGWRHSRGARAEVAAARALNIPVWPLPDLLLHGEAAPQVTEEAGMGACSCPDAAASRLPVVAGGEGAEEPGQP
ncbi:DUF4406 domain-containing protein [Actinomadura sp. NPDC048394]|uniref:DUF4406 domain-containing protein n=1 Tax=Actinomadura sp. NPDC048394 TaxID=3158223 RepID=UPI0034010D89